MSAIESPAAIAVGRPPRQRKTWDVVLSVVLLLLALALAAVLVVLAPFLVFVSDSCGSGRACAYPQMNAGVLLALVGPIILAFATVAATIVMLVVRRRSFWVPLVGAAAAVAIWLIGAFLVVGAVPGFTL